MEVLNGVQGVANMILCFHLLFFFLSVFHSQTTIKTPCMQKMNDITGEDGDET